jgi:hypothetical protein
VGQVCVSPICELDVYDQVGGGDGFASGLFHGLLAGESVETALKLGWADGALLTTTPGDATMVPPGQVKSFAAGGSARIHPIGSRSGQREVGGSDSVAGFSDAKKPASIRGAFQAAQGVLARRR